MGRHYGDGIALLALLIWLLRQPNTKTPFVFVTATKYDAPIPLNPWAFEDRQSLGALNKKNLFIPEHLPDWNESINKFEVVPKLVDGKFFNQFKDGTPLILYVSAARHRG